MQSLLISACLLGIPGRYNGKALEKDALILDLLKEKYHLIPFCPEIYGGLPTPRDPGERVGNRVLSIRGIDLSKQYMCGAIAALQLAQQFDCKLALLKDKSPSCGVNQIYDGTFSGQVKQGMGVTAELLQKNGISVYSDTKIELLLQN